MLDLFFCCLFVLLVLWGFFYMNIKKDKVFKTKSTVSLVLSLSQTAATNFPAQLNSPRLRVLQILGSSMTKYVWLRGKNKRWGFPFSLYKIYLVIRCDKISEKQKNKHQGTPTHWCNETSPCWGHWACQGVQVFWGLRPLSVQHLPNFQDRNQTLLNTSLFLGGQKNCWYAPAPASRHWKRAWKAQECLI